MKIVNVPSMPPFNIGDLLPEEMKSEFAKDYFKVGSVFKFYCNVAKKLKRLIYIADDISRDSIAMLFINTEINEFHFPTAELKAEHFKLDVFERSYIDHECFVDCTTFVEYPRSEIFDKCVQTPSIHIGILSSQDMNDIVEMVKSSKVLTRKLKKKYGF